MAWQLETWRGDELGGFGHFGGTPVRIIHFWNFSDIRDLETELTGCYTPAGDDSEICRTTVV